MENKLKVVVVGDAYTGKTRSVVWFLLKVYCSSD